MNNKIHETHNIMHVGRYYNFKLIKNLKHKYGIISNMFNNIYLHLEHF